MGKSTILKFSVKIGLNFRCSGKNVSLSKRSRLPQTMAGKPRNRKIAVGAQTKIKIFFISFYEINCQFRRCNDIAKPDKKKEIIVMFMLFLVPYLYLRQLCETIHYEVSVSVFQFILFHLEEAGNDLTIIRQGLKNCKEFKIQRIIIPTENWITWNSK